MPRKFIATLSAVGAVISLYLALTAYNCTGGCSPVHSSPYARIAGVPVAWSGVFGYIFILLAALANKEQAVKWLSLTGLGVEAYLVFAQAILIKAYCIWCLLSALIMFAVALSACGPLAVVLAAAVFCAGLMFTPKEQPHKPEANLPAVQEKASSPVPAEKSGFHVVDESGRRLLLDSSKPVLFFAPWCSHCYPVLKAAASLPADKRPALVYGFPGGDLEKDLRDARAEADAVGLKDPVYVCTDRLNLDRLPALTVQEKTLYGEKEIADWLQERS
ncbi:MAG: vitamin K epoxide reductase family protein [Syntrophothermus sp.]|uniref:vitamin K epoxide reductase family protein n=1 Tax=Syntrophothermus sp. TaxID=2736299 RepID=UPI00257E9EE2|nr:vitamin K epoxide reductase family protein [Syntrophothermus sp.]NSW84365.1 vitamin K epoxide reductase family protein [Syntrophothermus sp.]